MAYGDKVQRTRPLECEACAHTGVATYEEDGSPLNLSLVGIKGDFKPGHGEDDPPIYCGRCEARVTDH